MRIRRVNTRRGLRLETLEARQLLAGDIAPDPHSFISLYDYDGALLSNWRDLIEGRDQSQHGPADDRQEVVNEDALDRILSGSISGPTADSFAAQYKWTQSGGLGSPITVSYSYSNLLDGNLGGSLTTEQLRAGVEEALGLWANYAPLQFVEVVDSGPGVSDDTSYLAAGTANIRIGHHFVDGRSGTLAHAYYPTTYWGIGGDVHMDSSETWTIGNGGGIDFVEVMVHELGHSLGLGHELTNNAIMNAYYGGRYSGFGTSYLLADDIAGIGATYGSAPGSITPISNNAAPVLESIEDLTISVTTDTVDITLVASDADADALTYWAVLVEDPSDPNAAGPTDVSLVMSGDTLNIDPADHFAGTINVSASVTDGQDTTTQVFQLLVENAAPIIDPIESQNLTASDDSVTISITAADPDGSDVDLAAEAVVVDRVSENAYELRQQHAFHAAATDSYNYRGVGERYFYGDGSQWFYILPQGEVYRWGGSIAASTQVGQLDTSYHADLNRVFQAGPATTISADVGLAWSGSDLTIDLVDRSLETFDVIVTASDEITSSSISFTVNIINNAPVLTEIATQSMSHNQDSITVAVSAADVDGDNLSYWATAQVADAGAQRAYDLKQQYGLRAAATDSYNYRGHGERYFYGLGSQWFFMLADGSTYQWGGSIASSTLVGQVDSSYHSDLSRLFNAVEPAAIAADVDLRWSGTDLIVDPADGFLGSFDVRVTVTDQIESRNQTFTVNVSNNAPVIVDLDDLVISYSADSHTVPVQVTEVDGDPLTFTAEAYQSDPTQQQAYAWRQQYAFHGTGADYYNYRGLNERYFQGSGSAWFYMLPQGEVYRWGGSLSSSTLLGQLTADYHNDLNLLFNATESSSIPVDVTLNWAGNDLTIDPGAGLVGTFTVAITVSDGVESDSTNFQVTIDNSAPVITDIVDQQISYTVDSITLPITATDADADDLTYWAVASQIDATHQRAFDLVQQYSLRSAGVDHYNYRGYGERYFYGLGSQWFYMLEDGAIYRWGGSIATSSLVGQLDAIYHEDLNTLFELDEPSQTPVDVTLSWNGNELTIDPADGFLGIFDVVVTADDGAESGSTRFTVDVANRAAVVSEISTHTIAPGDDSITVAVDAEDPDGDALWYTARAYHIDEVQLAAHELMQTHSFRTAGNDGYYNSRGHGEKHFYGNGSQWYYMLSQGEIYRWGGSIAASTYVGQLDSSYHADLNKLFTVQEPQSTTAPVTLDWNDNILTATLQSEFAGTFKVVVDVSAGGDMTSTAFDVNVQGAEGAGLTATALADSTLLRSVPLSLSDNVEADASSDSVIDALAQAHLASSLPDTSTRAAAIQQILEELQY